MSFSIPMAALFALATTAQVPDSGKKESALAPFVGDEVVIAVHFDLTKWVVPTSSQRILGKMAHDADVAGVTKYVDGWVDALKKLGATHLYVLVDMADIPGFPVVVVPLNGKLDAKAIAGLLKGEQPNTPIRWPATETIRGAVIAGTPEALARIRDARPASRPEFTSALAAVGDAPIQIAISPSISQRRAIEESMPDLPPQLGGGPVTSVTRGMSWASITLTTEPSPSIRLVVQSKDADSAKILQKIARDGLEQLATAARSNPAVAVLADAIARMKPEVSGDRVILETDLEKTAALVSVPIGQVREASRRSVCVNNLKQIGLAMHNYHQTNNTFPPAYMATKEGKPLLSWRVLILPFLEEKELFDQFHLNESWDSPHNKPLIARMPKTFACASGSKTLAAEGKTSYLTARGDGTMFPGSEGVKIQEITDGTSNTIMVVDASNELAVIWTKPDDWSILAPLESNRLFGHHAGGTNFLFGDGAVRFLKDAIGAKLLQALTTRNGGEVISSDDY